MPLASTLQMHATAQATECCFAAVHLLLVTLSLPVFLPLPFHLREFFTPTSLCSDSRVKGHSRDRCCGSSCCCWQLCLARLCRCDDAVASSSREESSTRGRRIGVWWSCRRQSRFGSNDLRDKHIRCFQTTSKLFSLFFVLLLLLLLLMLLML